MIRSVQESVSPTPQTKKGNFGGNFGGHKKGGKKGGKKKWQKY